MSTIARAHWAPVIALAGLLAGGCAATRHPARGTHHVPEAAGRTAEDASIRRAVRTELANEPGVRASNVEVDSVDGIVTLRGTVPSVAAAKDAEEAARRAQGVRGVVDHLEVISR